MISHLTLFIHSMNPQVDLKGSSPNTKEIYDY